MLDEHNPLVKSFRMVRDRFQNDNQINVKLRLIRKRKDDGRMYNLPTASEVAALIPGDFNESKTERDIIVETRSGKLQRINELHPSYFPLQYPLLFPRGEDGYREDIMHRDGEESSRKKKSYT